MPWLPPRERFSLSVPEQEGTKGLAQRGIAHSRAKDPPSHVHHETAFAYAPPPSKHTRAPSSLSYLQRWTQCCREREDRASGFLLAIPPVYPCSFFVVLDGSAYGPQISDENPHDFYKLQNLLGTGAFGQVYKATDHRTSLKVTPSTLIQYTHMLTDRWRSRSCRWWKTLPSRMSDRYDSSAPAHLRVVVGL